MSDQRDTLRRELERRGHRVLPESPLPLDIDELAAMLTDQLNEADFAIHLFGERYGPRPDGSDASMPQLQFEAAGLWAGGGNVHQLVWVPDIDLQPVPAQQQLLYGLEQLEVGRNTEIVRAPLNLFKAHMLDRLDAAQRPAPDDPVAKPASSTRRFYLLHHQDDAAGASLVRKELEAKGFLVDVPLFRGTEAEMREVHETSLVLCDAVVIYHGGVSEHWLRMKQFDLVKAFGWGRTKPFAVKAVWVASSAMLSESSLAADLVILDSNGAQDMASLVSALDTELRNAARHA